MESAFCTLKTVLSWTAIIYSVHPDYRPCVFSGQPRPRTLMPGLLAVQYLHFKVQHTAGTPKETWMISFQMWSAILVLDFHRSLDPGQGQEALRTIASQLHSFPTPHIQCVPNPSKHSCCLMPTKAIY